MAGMCLVCALLLKKCPAVCLTLCLASDARRDALGSSSRGNLRTVWAWLLRVLDGVHRGQFFLLTNTHRVCIIALRGETMKQKDLINLFKRNGWWLVRQGSNHMVFTNGSETETVPRHKEVNELLAKAIIKRRGLK